MTFTLCPGFLDRYRNSQPKWGFLGYVTYKRTYAREKENGQSEEWFDTVKRVVEGIYTIQKRFCLEHGRPWSEFKAQGSAQEMFECIWDFRFTPPGRGLWSIGTEIIDKKSGAAAVNCGFVSTQKIGECFSTPFCRLMDLSMLGVGVGFDTLGKGTCLIKKPRYSGRTFIIPDTRQGWVDAVKLLLEAYRDGEGIPQFFDFSEIRPKGSPLKTFGGVSSGSKPLEDLLFKLKELLDGYVGSYLDSAGIVDISNLIGVCVVSGNIRRSAEIALGTPDDEQFLNLKLDAEKLSSHRWASNNTIVAEIGTDYSPFIEAIATNGEPGIFWIENARHYGRMGDPPDHKDMKVMGVNPCGEMALYDGEICNLVETFPAHHTSIDGYKKTLKYAYLYAKTVTLIDIHDEEIDAIVKETRRVGCSMSGIQQAVARLGMENFISWCDQGYDYLSSLDEMYSTWLGVNPSVRTTSVKPSGTVSLLCGATPGIHFPHSEYYIRRIRVQDTSSLIESCSRAGYHIEDDTYSEGTKVISFPVKERDFTKGKKEATIEEQFEMAAVMQRYWADNQVSVTISFKEDEVHKIEGLLNEYQHKLKSLALLPLSTHGYVQAPYEEIDEETYLSMIEGIKPLDLSNTYQEVQDKFCDGDTCTINLG